jgi:hypothetical protein
VPAYAFDSGTDATPSEAGMRIDALDEGAPRSEEGGGPQTEDMDGGAETAPGNTSWGVPMDGGPWSAVCPLSEPNIVLTRCSQPGLQCEYGEAWWGIACDQVLECSQAYWQTVSGARLANTTCEPEPGPNAPSCPPDTQSFKSKSPCTSTQMGLMCFYGQGTSCTCVQSVPDSGPLWDCSPDPGCPSTRPRVGAPCNTGLLCTYGSVTEFCSGSVWQIGYQDGG